MPRKREQRLRRELRRLRREIGVELHNNAERDRLATLAIRYVNEIYAPDLREPFSIANRRQDLVEAVRAYFMRLGIRRTA